MMYEFECYQPQVQQSEERGDVWPFVMIVVTIINIKPLRCFYKHVFSASLASATIITCFRGYRLLYFSGENLLFCNHRTTTSEQNTEPLI